MERNAHSSELGAFLKARRMELGPSEVGLPDMGGRRRVKGLRREEVALLASISTDYYTRLEQGRRTASPQVLDSIARVLRLDRDQREYMLELAGKDAARPRRQAVQKVHPQLRRLLDDLVTVPAVVLGRRMDILAWNSLAAALVTDFSKIPEKQRNYVRLVFTDPAVRALYPDWENVAHTGVSQLRMEAARDPQDQRLAALVGELSVRDEHFRQWWGAHHVAVRGMGTKVFRHPVAGDLTLDWDTLTCATDPDQSLVTWTAEPGSPSHDGLRFLASWAAEADTTAGAETAS
ncbi:MULTISPECIES: helix-turn-helix domain-containing protein [Streptomyces]|uniref:XRE family transcriptional regulator n=1 Tax=Streptomyces cinereoruber TaxID=67260 RepID=A0ABX6BQG8_9ACTN|nr:MULTISPECIES: helix-turn-helix domain-containing protein [Streptomyces]AVH94178.1 XRE family transcriptional regulator [Streptomyces sp. WAC00288]KYG51399.1 XRE family transcriptional regulator [Streptomyces sp. WAC04657]MBY8820110.1 helix-turn-helix domain-containing protein [Streptomyces cinereoruber]QEV36076.1 XRE family transcriptional regulator [Streptomyces cinereoruber]